LDLEHRVLQSNEGDIVTDLLTFLASIKFCCVMRQVLPCSPNNLDDDDTTPALRHGNTWSSSSSSSSSLRHL